MAGIGIESAQPLGHSGAQQTFSVGYKHRASLIGLGLELTLILIARAGYRTLNIQYDLTAVALLFNLC